MLPDAKQVSTKSSPLSWRRLPWGGGDLSGEPLDLGQRIRDAHHFVLSGVSSQTSVRKQPLSSSEIPSRENFDFPFPKFWLNDVKRPIVLIRSDGFYSNGVRHQICKLKPSGVD